MTSSFIQIYVTRHVRIDKQLVIFHTYHRTGAFFWLSLVDSIWASLLLAVTVWHTLSSSPLIGSIRCNDCWCRLKTRYLSLPTGRVTSLCCVGSHWRERARAIPVYKVWLNSILTKWFSMGIEHHKPARATDSFVVTVKCGGGGADL